MKTRSDRGPAVLQRTDSGSDKRQLVVATVPAVQANDQGQLIPMVDAVNDVYGTILKECLPSCNERDVQALYDRNIDGCSAAQAPRGTSD